MTDQHLKASDFSGARWTIFGGASLNVIPGLIQPHWDAPGMVEVMPVSEHEEEVEHFRRAVAIAEEAWAKAEAELQALREAAQAVVDDFGWSESLGFGKLIGALRAALGEKP